MSSLLSLINADGSPDFPDVKPSAQNEDRWRKFTTQICTNTYKPITYVTETDAAQSLQRIWQKQEEPENISHGKDSDFELCDDCKDVNFEQIGRVTRGNIP